MQRPRTLGAGITGAKAEKSLGGDDQLLPQAGPGIQCRVMLAMDLDREADALLFLGRHAAAQRLSHLACEMRLPQFRRLSSKQRYCLKEIADRVLDRGSR